MIVVLTGTLVAVTVVDAPMASASTRVDVMRAAASYGAAAGYDVGIAIVDTRSGVLATSGAAGEAFVSASVVKVLIATRLLLSGQMHGIVANLAYLMITQSDNDATDRLYPLAGGDRLEPWIARRYRVSNLGSPPSRAGWWGYTMLVPRGLAELYAKIKSDRAVAPWLLNAMHHIRRLSFTGEYQWWGLPSATSNAAVKQGWSTAKGRANVNTTGFVNGDRYAVVIMTHGPIRTYLTAISSMITHVARLLLPGGVYPDAVPMLTGLSRISAPTRGGWRVSLRGTAFTHVTAVMFGNSRASALTVSNEGHLTVTAPTHAPGWVNVRVLTAHGASPFTNADRFRFIAHPSVTSVSPHIGGTTGGATITLAGHNFLNVRQVLIGDKAARAFSVHGPNILTAVTSSHGAGQLEIRVITAYGESPAVAASRFLYVDPQPGVTAAKATLTTDHAIQLDWTNPTNAAFASVKICRSTNTTPQIPACNALTTITKPANTFLDATDHQPATTYYYALFATDRFGQSSPPMTVAATT